ncbi:pheromone-processing carboxypeptidase kex1 [Gossypium australe]|uniref:Pheromone-processing carboxypeptidase kex1 n=1 Tax=Gossypium australe TaxID=47621 RepID=A0A5B6VJ55_9ROSI|nr:pheromone-processing carboxypeptidase kex1 [Gossypium australe]
MFSCCRDTLMDNDENDSQSHNRHLAGEGNNKFPPVLRPYALPRFDFDDNLHGHLRFDSLVETEVFLGIESSEDNQWIEDFSRGGTGIAFSSSAAESCSISRCNNVWSEAASSESVEMLLKSVGQDETIPVQTISKNSDACDELGCIINQMEPTLKHGDSGLSKVGNDLQPALQSGEFPGKLPGLKDDVGGDHLLVEDVSQMHEFGTSVDSTLEDLNTRNTDLPVTKRDDSKEHIVNENLVEASVDQSVDDREQVDKCTGSQVDAVIHSVQNTYASNALIDSQDTTHLKHDLIDENVDGSASQNVDLSQEVQTDGQNVSENAVANVTLLAQKNSALDVHSKEDGHAIGNITTAGEPVDRISKGNSNLHMVEGCSEGLRVESPLRTSISEDIVLSERKLHDVSPMPFVGDTDLKEHGSEVSNMDTRNPMSLESNMDSTVQIACDTLEKKDSLDSDSHPDMKILSSKSEKSLVVDDNGSKGEGEGSHNTLGTEPMKECEESIVIEHSDDYKSDQTVSTAANQNTKLSSDSSNTDCGEGGSVPVIKGVDFSSSGTGGTADELASILQSDVAISGKSMECVLSPSGKDLPAATAAVSDQNKVQVSSAETNFSIMKTSGMTSEKGAPCETSGQSSCSKVDQSLSMEGTSIDEGQHGDHAIHGLSVEVVRDKHVSSIVSDSTVRGTDGAEAQVISKTGSSEAAAYPCLSVTGISIRLMSDNKKFPSGAVSIQQNNQTLTSSLPSTSKEPTCDSGQNHPEDSDPKLVIKEKNSDHVAMHHVDGESVICRFGGWFVFLFLFCTPPPLRCSLEMHLLLFVSSAFEVISCLRVFYELSTCGRAKTDNSSFPSAPSFESQTKIHMMGSGSSSADLDNPSCGSPIVIRTSEQFPSKIGNDGLKGSEGRSASISGVINGEENKDQSISEDMKGNYASPGDRTFTFEVPPLADLSGKEAGKNWQLFSTMQHDTISSVKFYLFCYLSWLCSLYLAHALNNKKVKGTLSTASLSKVGTKAAQEVSHANLQASESENVRGRSKGTTEGSGSKGTSDRRARRVGGKSAGKEATKKGIAAKEMTPASRSKRSASLSSAGIGQLIQSNEVTHSEHMEGATMKPFGVLSTSVSSLPDLNASASSSAVFHQPFTDLQQVQLRAQIFVYGALIQGTAPDEAYMISAFGGLDGGRTMWENAWRACIDRVHSQKSHLVSPETPMQMPLGAKTSDQSVKRNALQNKVTSSPVSRSASKGTPTTIVNPMVPLSSPLWSISTPSCDALQSTGIPRSAVMDYQQALSPFRPPPIRNFVGHNAPWMSQSPFRVPWVPQTSSFDARFPVLPITETVNLTPAREASVPHSSAMKQASTVPMVQSGSPTNVFAGTPLLDTKKATATRDQHSADPKPRKRKKSTVSEDPGQIKPHSQSESVSATVVTSNVSTPAVITTLATVVSKSSTDKFVTSVPVDHLEKGEQDSDQRVALSEETFGKLQEAQKQAEDASALAAAAVHHSQEIWNQLGKHKNSGLEPDFETELTSAAVAIAAAASVAKAAAAAAKVASNAALQAKLMADEALVSSGYKNSVPTNAIASDNVKKLGKATPASILRGENATTSSNSIIIAAREAARRRVEAASAASKQAENMDAIVKAAELAAEAVSQAGKIVAMGEPFPLTELVEARPEAYWKVPQASPEPNGSVREHIDSGRVEGPTSSARHPKEVQIEKREKQSVEYGMSPTLREIARESLEDHSRLTGGILGPTAASGKDKKGPKGRKASEIAKTKGVTSEYEIGFGPPSVITQSEHGKAGETSKNKNLREGSRVEVLRDGDGLKVAWFPADILDLKDGKAYVCYNELQSEDGDKLKEWVELEGEGDRAPRIRTARPVTAMPFEGTRKRRRAAMGDYNWAPGDRVDSWMQDSWWEGVVTEKSQTDETSFTVHFPARGETSVVKAWLLRPSLIWKNGSWVEGSSFQDNNGSSHEGDTPQEKRPRIGGPVVEARGEDKLSKSLDLKESWKPGDMRLLDLSDNEKIFNIGRSSRDENKPDSLKMVRTGLKKEGSRVIFGVPKPGKKRKFMEVSKHYVADQSGKTHETSDSAKFSKYLMPQGSEPRETRNKIEPKDKRAAVYRPKVLKSGKPPSVSSRTIHKDSLSNTLVSEPGDSAAADVSHAENISGKHNIMEFRSFSSSDGAAKGPVLFSSVAFSSDAPPKKNSASNAKSERVSKPKLGPASGKLAKIEEEKGYNDNSMKTVSEVEPRRSNRKIQPTSRLLEGLQSSLIISKIPSVSHDRSHKSQNRSSRGEP